MVKLKNPNNIMDANRYTTPKGNDYLFGRGGGTEVTDIDDITFFKKAGFTEFIPESLKAEPTIDIVKPTVTPAKPINTKVKTKK